MKKEKINKKDLVIKIILIIIIILLLIHNCTIIRNNNQNNIPRTPNGNVDIIEITCDSNQCKPVKPNAIESLSFAQKNISILKGNTLKLLVTIKPSELASAKLTWKSSDTKVVTVDANGKIKGISLGVATITVTSSNGKSATCTVTVTENSVDVKEIILTPNDKEIKAGSVMQVSALIKPENATNRELVWSSSDNSVATVDENGVVNGLKAGTVTITAKTKNGKVVGKTTITIEPKETVTPTPTPKVIDSLSFAQDNVSVKKGNTLGLTVLVEPSELASEKLTWKSSNTNIVTVDENGVVKGINEGTATIAVTSSNGKTATCTVTVTTDTIPVEEIILTPSSTTIVVGSTTQISAVVKPENATDRELVWSSSDNSVATVDSNGVVNGLKAGTVTITAKTRDGQVKSSVTITVNNPEPTPTPTPSPSPTPLSGKIEVYDDNHNPITWNGSTDLKIFTKSMYNIEGVIAPESSDTYKFIVRNSTDYNIKYSITFIETNDYNINMKYKLKKNNSYLVNHLVSCNELNISNQLLDTGASDTYYLDWKWVSSNNDTSIGKNPDANYKLQIKIEAESVNE